MKVLHINCNYVGTALHRIMVQHLNKAPLDVTVFVPIRDTSQLTIFKPAANEKVTVCFRKVDRLFYFLKQQKIIRALKEAIPDVEKMDLIHAFTLLTDGNVAYRLHQEYGIPYVVAIRDTDINDFFRIKPYLRPLGVKIMMNAEAVFFLSDTYRASVLERFVPEADREALQGKSFVIPNGIDDFWLENVYADRDIPAAEARLRQHCLSVACVGKIIKRKNIPAVQAALAILRERGWQVDFDVIGKAEDEGELHRIQTDAHTTYHPPTDQEGLIEYYRKADLFVLASHTETFGLVYAEAMSQGLPVVYTRGQGFDGQFAEGEVGYAVSDSDPEEIADTIEKLCGEYGRVYANVIPAVQKFRWDDICEKYREIYRGVVNDGNCV